MEASVVDGDAGGARQGDEEVGVGLGELAGPPLLGEVEVAEDLVADADRGAEE